MDYFMMPTMLLKKKKLLPSDCLTMSVIVTNAQGRYDKTTSLSVTEIHEQFPRLQRRTILRALKRLEENKCIEVIRNVGHKNKYKVLIDIPFVSEKKAHYDQ